MPRINLLPWRDTKRRERRMSFFVALGVALGAAIFVAFLSFLLFTHLIDSQEHSNQRLRDEIKIVDKQIEQINDLEAQKQRYIARMRVIEKLQRSRPEVVHLFDELVHTMPDGTYLTSVKENGTKLRLEGVAQSSTRVSTLMRNISDSQWLRNPVLEVIETKKDAPGSSFVLDAEQVSLADDQDTDKPAKGAKHGAHG